MPARSWEPLGLLHDPALEDLRGVPLLHLHRLLQDNGPAVADFVDKVDRGPGNLHPAGQGRFVHMKAIVPFAPKGGQQGRVHIDNPVAEGFHKVVAGNGEKARQHHQIHAPLLQGFDQSLAVGVHVGILLPAQGDGLNARLLGTLQGVGVRPAGDDHPQLAVYNLASLFRIDELLEIGAPTGHQHADVQHSTTPSSPSTTSPRNTVSSPAAAKASAAAWAVSLETATQRPMPMLKVLNMSRSGMSPVF